MLRFERLKAPRERRDGEPKFGRIEVDEPTDLERGLYYRELKERGVYIKEMERYLPLTEGLGRVSLFTDDPEEQAEIDAIDAVLADSNKPDNG